jgi:hypothetical protein
MMPYIPIMDAQGLIALQNNGLNNYIFYLVHAAHDVASLLLTYRHQYRFLCEISIFHSWLYAS